MSLLSRTHAYTEDRTLPFSTGADSAACIRHAFGRVPPDPRESLPEERLAGFDIDTVGLMNLSAFYGVSRRRAWAGGV